MTNKDYESIILKYDINGSKFETPIIINRNGYFEGVLNNDYILYGVFDEVFNYVIGIYNNNFKLLLKLDSVTLDSGIKGFNIEGIYDYEMTDQEFLNLKNRITKIKSIINRKFVSNFIEEVDSYKANSKTIKR